MEDGAGPLDAGPGPEGGPAGGGSGAAEAAGGRAPRGGGGDPDSGKRDRGAAEGGARQDRGPRTARPTGTGTPAGGGAAWGGLRWAERIARRRLEALAAAKEAADGLEAWKKRGRVAAPAAGRGVGRALVGVLGTTGETRAWLRAAGPGAETRGGNPAGDWRWLADREGVEHAVRTEYASAPEHRRRSWTLIDPDNPALDADEVRVLLVPLADEDESEETTAVEIRTTLHLDGRFWAERARVFWTTAGEAGEYPGEDPESPSERRLLEAARWAAGLFRGHAAEPIRYRDAEQRTGAETNR